MSILTGLVVVCRISYASYLPFDMTVYKDFVWTRSEAACHNASRLYHLGDALAFPYDLGTEVGKKRFEEYCGPNGKDCKQYMNSRGE